MRSTQEVTLLDAGLQEQAARERLALDTLQALRHARFTLFGETDTDAPFQAELDRLIALHLEAEPCFCSCHLPQDQADCDFAGTLERINQAEADALKDGQYSTPLQDALFIGVCLAFMALFALAVKYGPVIWRML